MHEVIDGIAQCKVNNALYAFDGTTHAIDGFARETRPLIQGKLAEHGTNNNTNAPEYLSKGWMYAQLVFWKILDGERRKSYYDRSYLMDLLATIDGSEPVAALPRHIFAKLETILEDDRSRHDEHQAVGSGRKRQHDSEEQAIEEMKPRKRERKDAAPSTTAALLSLITPSRQTGIDEEVKAQADDNVEDEEEASTKGKAELEAAETRLPARGAIWEEQWSKIEAFRRRQRLLTAVGTYALSCPLIEDRYPGLEGQLRLSVDFIPGNDDTGVLHGQLDLGLFTGAVAFAVSDTALHVWCYEKTRRPTQPNGEMNRLRAWGRDARTTLGLQRKSSSSCPIPRADFDLSAELRLCGEFRCNDDRKLFLRPGLILANDFDIDFTDLSSLNFTGRIKLPMLSDEPVALEGFKFEETATKTGRFWSEYNTANIRYGSTWNEP